MIETPLLLMANYGEIGWKVIICYAITGVMVSPVYPLILPVVGIPWSPFASVISWRIAYKDHDFETICRAIPKAFLYSLINPLLWLYLNQRIRNRRFRRGTIRFGYAVVYVEWGFLCIPFPFLLAALLFSGQAFNSEVFSDYGTSLVYALVLGGSMSALVWSISLIRLYRARWDRDLRSPDPGAAPPDILPAPVYLMPLVFSNLWMLWPLTILFLQNAEVFLPVWNWMCVPLFVACMSWIIWDWRRMKARRRSSRAV